MEIFLIIFVLLILGITIGLFINVAWLALGLILYFAPTIVAAYKKHEHTLWIFLVNLFFGWSVIGWLAALLWALDFDKVIMDFIEYRKEKAAKVNQNCSCSNSAKEQPSKETENQTSNEDIIEGEVVNNDGNADNCA